MKKSIRLLSVIFALMVILAFSCVRSFAVDIPVRPAVINVKSDFTSITLSWDAVENAKGYRVYQSVDGKWKILKTTTAKSYTVTGLKENTSYRFAVKPYTKADGKTYWASNYTTVNGNTLSAPSSPEKINVSAALTSITLSWNAVENATGYRVYQSVNGKWKVLKTDTAKKYIVSGLDVGSEYKFAVKSYIKVDGVTYWAKSYTTVYGNTLSAPESPEKINASADFTSIVLSWDAVENATGYRVYQSVNGKWKTLKTATAKQYAVTGLSENTEYKFAVKSYTKVNGVTYWAKKYTKLTVRTLGIPERPAKITAIKNSSVIVLSWEECLNATGYKIYQSVNGKWKVISCESTTKYTVEGLSANTTYKFAIKPYLEAYGNTYYATSYTTVSVKTEKSDSNAEWIWPLGSTNCYISTYFGYKNNSWDTSYHTGIDVAGSGIHGKPIYATRSGKVITASNGGTTNGIYTIIDHGDGYQSLYAHMSALNVTKGQYVQKGEMIGKVGSTGRSTGPHLHFEIRYDGKKIDPLDFVIKP